MLEKLIEQNRKDLVAAWRRKILETYPEDTARFMKNEPNSIANPVGHVFSQGVDTVFDEILSDDDEKMLTALNDLIRIRSVQNFRPAQAVGFVFALKQVVREKLGKQINEKGLFAQQLLFEDRVDRMALLAFETYMRCREDLFAIKARSLKNGPFKLHERREKILGSQSEEHKNNVNSKE